MDEAFSALDVLTGEQLRDDMLELWESKQTPMRGILVVSHNIEEAVLMADRVLIFASDPGRVRAELRISLPRPRNPESVEVRSLIDEVYALMTARTRAGKTTEAPAICIWPIVCRKPTSAVWKACWKCCPSRHSMAVLICRLWVKKPS